MPELDNLSGDELSKVNKRTSIPPEIKTNDIWREVKSVVMATEFSQEDDPPCSKDEGDSPLMCALPKSTVSLLTSGQIVTSVSSVVKEAMENALDAKADNIEIRLEDHGLTLIQIRDNGVGVKKENIPLMVAPHYTSKIQGFQVGKSTTLHLHVRVFFLFCFFL